VLWASADKLRAQMDVAEYKHLVLGLIFLKYISDTFVEQQKVSEMVSNPESDYYLGDDPSDHDEALGDRDLLHVQENLFWVPADARWESLRNQAKHPTSGN